MRVLVYGAGALGCELAHMLLQNKNNSVTLLARGAWKKSIDQNGLVIRHWAQRRTTVDKIRTIPALSPVDKYDLVFIVMQAGQLPAVLPALAANASRYFVFVGNNPGACGTLAALGRPAENVAFGFQSTAGRREAGRVISVYASAGMTVGGAAAPLPDALRLRLMAAFRGTKYRLTYYGNMDEWLKCHIAAIMPICYICYACGGDLKKVTPKQVKLMVDAMGECCLMLKAAGVPVNDAESLDYYREGTFKRRIMDAAMLATCKTAIGKLCVSDHAMHAVGEMRYLDTAFVRLRAKTDAPMPTWDALRAAMPSWDELEQKTGR